MHSSRMRTVRISGRILGGGGDVCSRGVSAPGGVSLLLGVCLLPGGMSALGGCLLQGGCLLWGVSAPEGVGVCLLPGVSALGGCLLLGECIPACTEADTPTPLWTDRRL